MVAPASPVPASVGVVIEVALSPTGAVSDAGSSPGAGGTAGATLSTVTDIERDGALTLAALSSAIAFNTCVPAVREVVVTAQCPVESEMVPPTIVGPSKTW